MSPQERAEAKRQRRALRPDASNYAKANALERSPVTFAQRDLCLFMEGVNAILQHPPEVPRGTRRYGSKTKRKMRRLRRRR